MQRERQKDREKLRKKKESDLPGAVMQMNKYATNEAFNDCTIVACSEGVDKGGSRGTEAPPPPQFILSPLPSSYKHVYTLCSDQIIVGHFFPFLISCSSCRPTHACLLGTTTYRKYFKSVDFICSYTNPNPCSSTVDLCCQKYGGAKFDSLDVVHVQCVSTYMYHSHDWMLPLPNWL